MHSTTLSFANLHNHGALFENVIRARRESSFAQDHISIPETLRLEYDQYDTPQSRWLAVHDDTGQVLAGVRLTPTTAQCGIYSYMIRDAQNGLLESIPTDLLLDQAPVSENTWEVTRGFIRRDIPAGIRHKVRRQFAQQLLQTSREEGVTKLLALLPSPWRRWTARCDLKTRAAGPAFKLNDIMHQAVWIDFARNLN